MANGPHYVTSDEFSRYITEENNFRTRLEARLANDHLVVRADLVEIKTLVKETNGRVGKAEQTIGVIQRELEAIKSEDQEIESTVQSIKEEGCNQYANHVAILSAGGDPAVVSVRPQFRLDHFSTRQKAVAGAGIALVMWPAIQEIVKLARDILVWIESHAVLHP